MNTLVNVDEDGRLVLPKDLRDSLHLRGKTLLSAKVVEDHLELRAVTQKPFPLKRKGRFLVISATGEKFDAVSALAESRDER